VSGLNRLTLKQALTGIREKKFTAQEIQQDVLFAIAEKNPELNAYLAHDTEQPDQKFSGELAGVPIAVKDNFLTQDFVTTASSKVLESYRPQYESTVTQKLRDQGAYIVGKTNLDAWAHGSSTETSDFGPSKNPRNPDYMPGGSSGGSAAAVAADLCIAAIGSETAGSIRQPSAWCGNVGLKPTYGRVSRYGVVAMASSMDSPGPMTKTVEDAALLLEMISGQDPYDGTTDPRPVETYSAAVGKDIKGMKIGILYSDLEELKNVQPYYEKAYKQLEELGAIVEPVSSLDPHYAIATYAVLQRGEVSSNLARYDGIRYGNDRSTFGTEAKRRIMIGTYTLSKGYADKHYVKAQQVRALYMKDFARLFEQYDLLVSPVSPGYALPLGESEKYPYFGELMDMLLEPSSITGLPGISVPCYFDSQTGLPLGLNIMAPHFEESRMIQAASAYESAAGWNTWLKEQA
jgi:aspartyl-tRNA(Asn)/glutamyl-tRNA(Gln) amidotransferase subunit A